MLKIGTDEISKVMYHSNLLRYGLKNGALIWGEDTPLEVNLPQFNVTTDVANYLRITYPFDLVIKVTNTLNQPSLIVGDLGHIVALTLVNEGTISGTNPGDDGLILQAPVKLVDNGIIRGAGGNGSAGGNGGRGGKGGKGADSSIKTTKYETQTGDMACTDIGYGYRATLNTAANPMWSGYAWDGHGNWLTNKDYGTDWVSSSTIGDGIASGDYRRSTYRGGNYCPYPSYVKYYDIERRYTVTTTAIGGAGGSGGAAGVGGTAGRGISYNTNRTNGAAGTNGIAGNPGLPSTPAGGNSGGKGGTGGKGGSGGNGGDWGVDGSTGSVGTTGGTGFVGEGGGTSGTVGSTAAAVTVLGAAAGVAIVGTEFLV